VQKKSFRLEELSDLLGADLKGDASCVIDGLADIESAQASQLSFVAGKGYEKLLARTSAGAVLLRPELAADYAGNCLILDNPYWGYARLSGLFSERPSPVPGVHPTAVVADSATVAPTASIGARCVIEAGVSIGAESEIGAGSFIGANTSIGDRCLIHPNVTVYHGVSIGHQVTIHSATVIGSDGFGFAPTKDGWEKIHQLGGVVIGDKTDIGSGCTIDRGALKDTIIEQGVIIDNQVHIAHNVKVGKNTAIAGCTGIAGSTEVGAHCLIGGSVNISGHLKIADHVQFNGASVVTKSIGEPGVYASGTPLQAVKQWRKNAVRFGQLDKLFERVKQFENDKARSSRGSEE
jgi:UDP-3-O-[3-hydroxymyristoyl] glucosamine N-acyltransferase